MLANFFAGCVAMRRSRALLPMLALGMLAASGARGAEDGVLHLRCASQNAASWPLTIDTVHGTVNERPAKISDGWISWRDPGAGIYELERATGKLQLRAASSTGGFFLHYACAPE